MNFKKLSLTIFLSLTYTSSVFAYSNVAQTQSEQTKVNDAPKFVNLNFYDKSAQQWIYTLTNHDGMYRLQSGPMQKLANIPIGSYACIVQNKIGDYVIDRFKVINNQSYYKNDLTLYGTWFKTWYGGNFPNFQYLGWITVTNNAKYFLEECITGRPL